MTDPTIVTLDDFPDPDRDAHWVRENLEAAQRGLERIPHHFRDAIVDHPQVEGWVRDLVRQAAIRKLTVPAADRGPSMLLIGPTGTGKTFLAYGAIRALSMTGLRVAWRFTTASDLYASLRPRPRVDSEEVFLGVAHSPLLVVDDIGANTVTEWTEEITYRLINHRYEHAMPTVFTSNVPPKDLAGKLGERATSRLIEMTTRVVLKGEDRRRKGAA